MADNVMLLALFDEVDPASNAIEKLHDLGIENDKMEVISGIPITHQILGRPEVPSSIPRLATGGAFVGMLVALFLIFGIPSLFPLLVGGQPIFSFPPFYIVGFEMIMLGLMGTAFLGLFIAGRFPSYEKKEYITQISDGKIAVVFSCPSSAEKDCIKSLQDLGAASVEPVEAKEL
jgi:hypothetical protein